MKKLVCFGDSFIDSTKKFLYPVATILKNKLNLPLINYGVSGSGIQYSLIKFLEYTRSDLYDKDDIIIFVVSNRNRFYNQKLDIHVSGAGYISFVIDGSKDQLANPDISDEERNIHLQKVKFLEENKKYIDWTCTNFNDFSIDTESLSCLGLLNTWASHNVNKFIVMNAFDIDPDSKDYLKLFKQTNNFLPILIDGGLKKYSVNEFVEKKINMLKWADECRVNHLSPVNREIFANLLVSVINTNDISMFDESLFQTRMYNNFDDILDKFKLLPRNLI